MALRARFIFFAVFIVHARPAEPVITNIAFCAIVTALALNATAPGAGTKVLTKYDPAFAIIKAFNAAFKKVVAKGCIPGTRAPPITAETLLTTTRTITKTTHQTRRFQDKFAMVRYRPPVIIRAPAAECW